MITTYSNRFNEDQGCRFRTIKRKGVRVSIDLTNRCNLQCRHCFACLGTNELNTNQLVKIIDQLPLINTRKIILTGGEPLLRSDLETIIKKISAIGIGVDLNTNLDAFTFERAKSLHQAGLREISTSLDGPEEYHDWLRCRNGHFSRVVENIRLANKMGFIVDVHGVCTPKNIYGISEIVDLCKTLEVSSLTIFEIIFSFKASLQSIHSFKLTENDKRDVKIILDNKRAQYKDSFSIRTVDIFKQPSLKECQMGNNIFGITPNGYLIPCLLANYKPGKLTDLKRVPLVEALRNIRKHISVKGPLLGCTNNL
jgi:Fe-coproporphyrin III synthase